jgi:hypothetical protein
MKLHIHRRRFPLNFSLAAFIIATFLVSSCDDAEENLSTENTQNSNNESTLESTSDELDDLATIALNSQDAASGGRIRAFNDHRLACEGTTVVPSNVSGDKTSGTVTITFPASGCEDNHGNVRKGTVVVQWSGGKWFNEGSTQTITLQNYSVNDVGITGTRTLSVTDVSGTLSDFTITWDVTAQHSFSFTDQTSATRSVSKTKAWHHSASADTFTISNGTGAGNAAAGTNRHGRSYTVNITTPLVFTASCARMNQVFLPESGVKVITNVETEKTITIDFGDGTCDNKFTVTAEGVTQTVTARNDG